MQLQNADNDLAEHTKVCWWY